MVIITIIASYDHAGLWNIIWERIAYARRARDNHNHRLHIHTNTMAQWQWIKIESIGYAWFYDEVANTGISSNSIDPSWDVWFPVGVLINHALLKSHINDMRVMYGVD